MQNMTFILGTAYKVFQISEAFLKSKNKHFSFFIFYSDVPSVSVCVCRLPVKESCDCIDISFVDG